MKSSSLYFIANFSLLYHGFHLKQGGNLPALLKRADEKKISTVEIFLRMRYNEVYISLILKIPDIIRRRELLVSSQCYPHIYHPDTINVLRVFLHVCAQPGPVCEVLGILLDRLFIEPSLPGPVP
jgi:hypothetical protein